MGDQIFWRLGGVFFLICFIFLIPIFISFYFYSLTKGKIYRLFKEHPKRFLLNAFVMSLVFGIVSTMFDFANILLSPIMIEPVDIGQSIIFATTQCLLVFTIGFPIIWLSFRLAIPLAHKILQNRFEA